MKTKRNDNSQDSAGAVVPTYQRLIECKRKYQAKLSGLKEQYSFLTQGVDTKKICHVTDNGDWVRVYYDMRDAEDIIQDCDEKLFKQFKLNKIPRDVLLTTSEVAFLVPNRHEDYPY